MAVFQWRSDTEILRDSPRRFAFRFPANIVSMPDPKRYVIAVTAHSTYLPDQSDEEDDRYVFAYTIRITNTGTVTAQVVSRHWIITDADNQVQEVRGMGVVGEQPVLKPGDTFEYSSGSSIPTAVGTMRGSYQLVAEDGTRFEVPIPEFALSVPRVLH
jgi:ApaG protein